VKQIELQLVISSKIGFIIRLITTVLLVVFLLGGKYLFESVFGVKYPQVMAPTKRTPTLGRIDQYRAKARSDAQQYF
jgi:hypothetical protein